MLPDVQRTPIAQEVPPTAPVGQPPIATPATTGQGWNRFLRILGVVLAIGAGIGNVYAVTAMWLSGGTPVPGWLPIVGVVGCGVLAAVAAALLRSWWGVLIVPVAVCVGAQLGFLMIRGFNFQDGFDTMGTFSFVVVLFAVLPATVGSVIGVPIGKWLERSIRR